MQVFTHEDLLPWVRSHPDMYLRPYDPLTLAGALVDGALRSNASWATIVRHAGWFIVCSDNDWINQFRGDASVHEFFTRIHPFKGLQNGMHYEVVATAFGDPVLTATTTERLVIRGDGFEECVIDAADGAAPHWKRLVAFRMDDVPVLGFTSEGLS